MITALPPCTSPPLCVARWLQWLQHQHPELVQALRSCNHHYDSQHLNAWHLEGDVWTHTMLVVQSYAMTGIDDVCVGLTALLHDIGKPKARYILHDRQRHLFKGHESVSAWLSWKLLPDPILDLTIRQKTQIFALIALHGTLYLDAFRHATSPDTRHTSTHASTFDLHKVARSFYGFGEGFWCKLIQQIQHDMQGQITSNPNQKAELLQMSSAVLAQFPELRQKQARANTLQRVPFICLIGLPGSGKTTFRQKIDNYLDHLRRQMTVISGNKVKAMPSVCVISRDDLLLQITGENNYRQAFSAQANDVKLKQKIDQTLTTDFDMAIAEQRPIVLDMTNLSRNSRAYWLARLPAYYRRTALVCIADYGTIYQRNDRRHRNEHKRIPKHVIHDMMLRFEHPLFDEFEQIDYLIDGQTHAMTIFNDVSSI